MNTRNVKYLVRGRIILFQSSIHGILHIVEKITDRLTEIFMMLLETYRINISCLSMLYKDILRC